MRYDAVILGGGAAGLFCAATAGRRGRRVALVEHNERPGRKILISGGGKCNFTNRTVEARNFLSANPHFATSALARYTPTDFLELLRKHKLAWHEKTLGQLFCDGSAREILRLLEDECEAAGVEIHTRTAVRSVSRDTHFAVETSRGRFEAAALVIATGGLSIPKLGATGLGYDLARQFGLQVIEPYPALVPLVFSAADQRKWSELAGVSTLAVARAARAAFEEQVLFTHRGLSGPAILQVSSYWKPGADIRLDLAPRQDFAALVEQRRASGDTTLVKNLLGTLLPARLAARWLDAEGFHASTPPPRQVDQRLHDWRVSPAGSEGFAKAEVTGGGVDTRELSSQTMEARAGAGLFFIGEVVDVTGWLGGYNFQWAWASGHAAGQAL